MSPPSQGNRFRPVLIGCAVVFALLLLVAIVSEAVFHTSIDPTEQTFTVTLTNDTPQPVVVHQCDATCNSFHERDELQPGASVPVNTSGDNVANWWAVTDGAGRRVGCLPLRFAHKSTGVVVLVSSATACP